MFPIIKKLKKKYNRKLTTYKKGVIGAKGIRIQKKTQTISGALKHFSNSKSTKIKYKQWVI